MEKIIAACGNDCAACPRYTAHPYASSRRMGKVGYAGQKISCDRGNSGKLWRDIPKCDRQSDPGAWVETCRRCM